MPRRSRYVISAAALVVVLGGGYLARGQVIGSAAQSIAGQSADSAQHLGNTSVLTALQPAPSAHPGATPSSAPASPKPTTSPRPAKTTPKPTTKPTKTTAKPQPTKTTPPASHSIVDQMLAQINGLRKQHGLPPYTLLSGLLASAHKHNLLMEGSCGMSHQCPGEASLGSRISAQGVHWSSCGENIGWSGPHPNTSSAKLSAAEGLTTAMYNEKPPDDGHRLNLLSSSFHHIGIDVVRDSKGNVWLTQDFSS